MDKKVIHSIFEEVAKRSPLNIAIKTEDGNITYNDLNVFSNRISSLLKSLGYAAGKMVNVVAPSSIQLVAALLGVFKSGNIYLPVDFSAAEKRLKQIFTDTFDGVVIVSPEYKALLLDFVITHGISMEYMIVLAEQNTIELYQLTNGKLIEIPFAETDSWSDNVILEVTGNDSNYIFYTSGSTGEGKAIEGLHVSLSHFIQWEIKEFQIDESFRISQLTQITFDASLRDIFVALIAGGTLCIPSLATKTNPVLLLNWLQEEKISMVHCVPSLFRLLTKELQFQESPAYDTGHLKYILMAGELLYSKDILNWRKVAGTKTSLVNLYGATETTLIKTFHRIEQVEESPSAPIPVGMPISNTIVAIVKDKNICKSGEIGEIYIKTPFATKGYYKNEALTRTVFVQNPLVDNVNDIVYKTGDLGRYLPDGNIEVLGRLDNQVKINGIRIELNEIERAVLDLEDISGVVVKSHRSEDHFMSLIAYYTGEKRDAEQFRTTLSNVLNQHAIPSYFIHMVEFPLNMNGKIDKKALPVPEDIMMGGVDFESPAEGLESTLAKFWREILGLERIGRNISFFGIGGHSLRAIQLAARIQREFGISIKITDIFLHKTIRELAFFIENSSSKDYRHIYPAEPASSYPLSPAQRRLWILSQFDGASAAYHMPVSYVFEGELSLTSLTFAFQQLMERHEILRTVFKADEHGEIGQFIRSAADTGFEIGYHDLRNDENAAGKLDALIQATLAEPFSLSDGPLIRAALFQLEDKKFIFTYEMHHIISDGWSMEVLISELLSFYNHHTANVFYAPAPLRIQYKDFVLWQQEQLSGESLGLHKDYWLKQFEGDLPVLELSTDRTRPSVKTYNGNIVTQKIGKDAFKRLKQVLDQEESTLFMGLLSVMNALFYRYTGQEDMIIGSPIAGREHDELEDQIGFYLNMLALRTRFNGAEGYLKLLQEVKSVTVGAYEHQIYPFDELVDELNLQRDMSRSALFDVMIILQNNKYSQRNPEDHQNNLAVSAYGEQVPTGSKYDLTFNFSGEGEDLVLNLEYNTDIFNRETIVRLGKHFNGLLDAITQQPSLPVSQLVYLAEEEQLQLLGSFNDTAVDHKEDQTITDLFRERATAVPEDIAIVFEDTEFTYKDLDEISDRLADYLSAVYRIKENDLIGIQLERTEWLVITMLAVLKSGAAYIPIDPEYPAERIEYIIADSKCKAVLDQDLLSDFKKAQDHQSVNSVKNTVKATSLAYCIYTSGTTGNPKGCLLTHKNVVNFFVGMNEVFGEEPGTLLSLTNFTFDISVLELIWTLTLGYKVIIQPSVKELLAFAEDGNESVELIYGPLRKHRITHLQATPSMAALLQTYLGNLDALHTILLGGERLPAALVRKLSRELPGMAIYNMYGPTETTIWSACWKVDAEAEKMLIGKPISNTKIYILDANQQLLPVGAEGELYIGGKGVAKGYINKPELSAERFIADPFNPGERLYRTGDFAKWLPDGNIDYIGRKDDQVKLHGHRIELAEIESVLQKNPLVSAASVLISTNTDGEKELVAYVSGPGRLNVTDLRAGLVKNLPNYMVPGNYIQVDHFPLTPNGKVDKRKLQNNNGERLNTAAIYVAPKNDAERKLESIWKEILNRDHIGIKDNFFDIGGNSVKIVRMITAVNKTFNEQLSVAMAFKFSNISALAEHLLSKDDEVNMKIFEEELDMSFNVMEETFSLLSNDADEN